MADPATQWLLDLWGAAKTAGPFGLMIITYLWYAERTERRTLQDEKNALLERVIKGLNDANSSIQTSAESMHSTQAALSSLERIILAVGRKSSDG